MQKNLGKLEVLKPKISKRYERYTQLTRERQIRKEVRDLQTPSLLHEQPHDAVSSNAAEPLEAGENKDLAVRLAKSEISRRETVRKTQRQASVPSEDKRSRRSARAYGEHASEDQETNNDLSKRIRDVKVNVDSAVDREQRRPQRPPTARSAVSGYQYPTVPRQQPLDTPSPLPIPDLPVDMSPQLSPPSLPPKEQLELQLSVHADQPPPLPTKTSPTPAPALPEKVLPEADTSSELNPSSFTFKPSAYLENGTPLRTVFLPPPLRSRFLAVAAENTCRNLETCGILCGTLISNALFISRLLIPEQISTSDTCETVNESAIFDYCDSEDLMVLGWIHTHPTQTCFMSSRDLHTHCGYQVMLPESIAIVCAPSKNPDWGVFRLTDPPGLKTVLNCTQTGLFHPHSEQNIYTEALRPGHVFEAKGLEFEMVDLRPR